MSYDDTLLAYLVSSFPGNTENIATEALKHILRRSNASVEALNDVVRSGVKGVNPITDVESQVVHADGTIPDLVGFDENRKERVLIEVKFWAQLTNNQPNGYLNRLPDDGPAALVFLAPEDRIQSLWRQLRNCVNGDSVVLEEVDSERKCARLGDTQKHLMIVSWGSLLDGMSARSRGDGESSVETEIRQLRSVAKYADEGAFKPIQKGEEFGKDSELRQRQYKRLIDSATERGIEQGWASRNGLRATPRSYGYGRYVRLRETIVWFGVNVDQFEATGKTPLWVNYWRGFEDKTDQVGDTLGMRGNWAPVDLKRDVEYPEMLDGVVESLKRIADVFHQALSQSARNQQNRAHGEPLEPITERVDGTLLFSDGSEGRPGLLTEAQQRQVDIQNACRLYGQTGDDSELVRLGIL